MRIELTSSPAGADVLAVGLSEAQPHDLSEDLLATFGPGLVEHLEDEEFKGKVGKKLEVATLGRLAGRWLLVVGTGAGTADDLRHAAGIAGDFARTKGAETLELDLGGGASVEPARWVQAAVEGVGAGNYRYDRYKPETERKAPLSELRLLGVQGQESAARRGRLHAQAQSVARDLVNAPADDIYPATLAQEVVQLAADNLKVEVWDEGRIQQARMGGIWGVGRGSSRPPRFVHARFTPKRGPAKASIAVIGKGVTFDAGGLSIKPTSGMLTMRCDMGGAAAVVGMLSALVELDPQVEVHAIFGAVENMLGANAYKLGDVLTMRNGKTVEVHNTDAEGRLVLADCLAFATELGVDSIIDMATLTGGAVVALGEHYGALFSDSDDYVASWQAASEDAGEALWRMPLEPLYKEMLKAEWGAIKNVGGREASSITAALFLEEFVGEHTWAHFDIAGPAFLSKKDRYLDKGGTGFMVRTLLRWLESR